MFARPADTRTFEYRARTSGALPRAGRIPAAPSPSDIARPSGRTGSMPPHGPAIRERRQIVRWRRRGWPLPSDRSNRPGRRGSPNDRLPDLVRAVRPPMTRRLRPLFRRRWWQRADGGRCVPIAAMPPRTRDRSRSRGPGCRRNPPRTRRSRLCRPGSVPVPEVKARAAHERSVSLSRSSSSIRGAQTFWPRFQLSCGRFYIPFLPRRSGGEVTV